MNIEKAIRRFYKKVEKTDGCWLWIGAKKPTGYGNFYLDGRVIGAHCAAYILFVGDIPDGMFVCHECDNPSCVNPNHLFAGTSKQNTEDMMEKGRAIGIAAGGDYHPGAKLSASVIPEIRIRRANGEKLRSLAQAFDVCEATISYICSNKIWKSA